MKKPSKKQAKKRKPAGKKKTKKKYKVRNWREYNESLVNRGKVIFHITEEAIEEWEETKHTGKRGRPKQFSDAAIETALSLQQVFRLPLRQAEGLLATILEKLGAEVSVPDYSTMSIRAKTLSVSIRTRSIGDQPLHVAVDSTGAKVYGEGEWKVRKHGWGKHRTWKKLHIGVNEKTGDILVSEVTGNNTSDGEVLPRLLDQLPPEMNISQLSADGAYDTRKCYETLHAREVPNIAIPPQKNAKIWEHGNKTGEPHPRDVNLRRIRKIGRKKWKEEIGYHRRSLSETTIFRIKTIFGDRVSARTEDRQRTQLLLRCRLLNRMTMIGMPDSFVA